MKDPRNPDPSEAAPRAAEPEAPGLVLYHTSACHLCEQAEALLRARGLAYVCVDVAGDEALLEAYGVRIPVLRRPDGAELGWPFDARSLEAFVGGRSP